MPKKQSGYREIEHTADWELEAWAPDLPGLLEQAARGMYVLSGTLLQPGHRQSRSFSIEMSDPENLLVQFLSELLYYSENEGLAFDSFAFNFQDQSFSAYLEGSPISETEKEIKAVTYHNLEIRQSEQGLQVRIVFDV
jgi:SHS2 domain-containing protein